jgi:hypothetical protein
LASVVQLVRTVTGWSFSPVDFGGGWNTAITSGAVAFGLYFAGRAATEAVSRRSRRLVADVRPWVALAGTALAAWLLIVVIRQPQNEASVIAAFVAPLGFALGALWPALLPRQIAPWWLLLLGFFLVIPISLVAIAATPSEFSDTPSAIDVDAWNRRAEVIGPWWVDPMSAESPVISSGGWGTTTAGATQAQWELSAPGALRGLQDLRAEAWHADPIHDWAVDTRFTEPFATASVQRDATQLRAAITLTTVPGVGDWQIALTGVDTDGTRYLVDLSMGGRSTFTGTPLDWILATADNL